MWIEQYMEPILENTGWEEEDVFLDPQNTCAITKDTARRIRPGMFLPMKTLPDGRQWLAGGDSPHSLVVGTTGSGKSRDWIMPGILAAMAAGTSMFCLDVKGEIRANTIRMARKKRYRIVDLSLRGDMTGGDGYNPLQIAADLYKQDKISEAETALAQLAEMLFPPLPANSHIDPFWRRTSINLFMAIGCYIGEFAPHRLTFAQMEKCINEFYKTEEEMTALLIKMKNVQRGGAESTAYRNWMSACSGSEATNQNVLGSFMATFTEFIGTGALSRVTSEHSLDFSKLASPDRPMVIYLQMDDSSDANYTFARLMMQQIYHQLCEAASATPERKLPRHFAFFLDELANSAKIEALKHMLSMARSRNISLHMGLQSLTQLDDVYGVASAETIRSNISIMTVLNTSDAKTWNRISELCSVNQLGAALMPAHRVARMKRGEALIIRRGLRPYMTQLADVTTSPWFCGLEK